MKIFFGALCIILLVATPLGFNIDITPTESVVQAFGGGDGGSSGGDGGAGGGDSGGDAGGAGDIGGGFGGGDGGTSGTEGDGCCGDDSGGGDSGGFGGGDGGTSGTEGDGCCGGGESDEGPDDSSEPDGDGGEQEPDPDPAPICDLSINPSTITVGESATLTWTTSNASSVTLDGSSVAKNDSQTVSPNAPGTYTYTIVADGLANSPTDSVDCPKTLKVEAEPVDPAPICDLSISPSTITIGESATLTWTTSNAASVTLNDVTVAKNDSKTVSPNSVGTHTYTIVATGLDNSPTDSVDCPKTLKVEAEPVDPVPVCELSINPSTITLGDSATLTWTTSNAASVTLNDDPVSKNDSQTVTPSAVGTYTYTIVANGLENSPTDSVDCPKELVVKAEPVDPAPICDLSINPSTITVGESATLTWTTSNASSVTLDGSSVAKNDSQTVSPNAPGTYTYTIVADGLANSPTDSVDCPKTLKVTAEPAPITCEANVDFTVSDNSIKEGQSVTLDWSTDGGITNVSIDNGIDSTELSGSESINLNSDTTFTLTASDGTDTIDCPLSVSVAEDEDNGGGGGGGGSASPRCELEISDDRISRGDEIKLRWDTRSAADIRLFDNHGEEYVNTEDFLNDEKDDLLDGEITLTPNRDTTYTLIAERGSRDDECEVDVEVGGGVTVSERRDQQPLVAGISLSQTPYTGFEAGPVLTIIFYILLGLWALFVTYVLVIRRESIAGFSLPQFSKAAVPVEKPTDRDRAPHLFVESAPKTEAVAAATSAPAPTNLPIASAAAFGTVTPVAATQTSWAASKTAAADTNAAEVTALEDHAHAHYVLMSSDAIAHFMSVHPNATARVEALDTLMHEARGQFPTEDGWLVLNLERTTQLCPPLPTVTTAPVANGNGSLAESILMGNVGAAYALIGNRPMVALANAASDLDALYRSKNGADVAISELLAHAGAHLTNEQLSHAIAALTGALDGTYNSEEEAVKMAIMKAIKAIS